jgi:hypothetical protein
MGQSLTAATPTINITSDILSRRYESQYFPLPDNPLKEILCAFQRLYCDARLNSVLAGTPLSNAKFCDTKNRILIIYPY